MESALMISARLSRARCASRCRMRDALLDRKCMSRSPLNSTSFLPPAAFLAFLHALSLRRANARRNRHHHTVPIATDGSRPISRPEEALHHDPGNAFACEAETTIRGTLAYELCCTAGGRRVRGHFPPATRSRATKEE